MPHDFEIEIQYRTVDRYDSWGLDCRGLPTDCCRINAKGRLRGVARVLLQSALAVRPTPWGDQTAAGLCRPKAIPEPDCASLCGTPVYQTGAGQYPDYSYKEAALNPTNPLLIVPPIGKRI